MRDIIIRYLLQMIENVLKMSQLNNLIPCRRIIHHQSRPAPNLQ